MYFTMSLRSDATSLAMAVAVRLASTAAKVNPRFLPTVTQVSVEADHVGPDFHDLLSDFVSED
jgi:polyisoprenoid-binding protein YceI